MSIISDFHIHTYLCKHAAGRPVEYLESAYKKGLKTIGFADHCPLPLGFDPWSRMDISQFDEYLDVINSLRNNSLGIEVLLGLEVDWVPGRMDEVFEFFNSFEYDYLIGSVHHTGEFPFDHPDFIEQWDSEDNKQYIWDRYVDKLFHMISSGKFDIIGHLDLPKKFGFYPKDLNYFHEKIEECFEEARKNDVAIELNTAGLRKPVKEIYPSLGLLKSARKHNVKITFGSDAHAPEEVAYNFSEAKQWAKRAGYTTYLNFTKKEKQTLNL